MTHLRRFKTSAIKLSIGALVVLILSACRQAPDYCVGCSDKYPYYADGHLASYAHLIDELPPVTTQQSVHFENLKKAVIFPVSSRRHSVVGFAHEFLVELEKRGWEVVDSDRPIRLQNADILVSYMTEMSETEKSKYFYKKWKLFEKNKAVKISILEDFNFPWHIDHAKYSCSNADAILVRYPEALHQLIPDCGKAAFHFPHSASRSFFDAQVEFSTKKPAILLSGAINVSWYPLRVKAKELLREGNALIVERKHPGYHPGLDPVKEAKEYANQISAYQLGLTGAGMGKALAAPYILAKHFEIPATGSVMVTDKIVVPLMQRLGFIEDVHYLTSTPDMLESDLERWLSPEFAVKLQEIGEAGRKLVAERHTLARRVEEFERVVYWAWRNKQDQ